MNAAKTKSATPKKSPPPAKEKEESEEETPPFGERLRLLYHGRSLAAHRFRSALVAFDIVTILFIVVTSLSSGGNGIDQPKGVDTLKANNPCLHYHNAERGYVRCAVTPKTWTSDYMVIDDVEKPGGKTTRRASFVIENGSPIVQDA